MAKIIPFGINILIEPIKKDQVLVSDQGTLCEYGKVIAVGSDVQHIKEGMMIGYTVWGLNSLEINGTKHYFVPEDSRFVLGQVEL